MKSFNLFCADRPALTLVVLLIPLLFLNVDRAGGVEYLSLMEYLVLAIDCLAMVGSTSKSGWMKLLTGLQLLKPIDHRTRIEDTLAFRWNDVELTQFVTVLIKDDQNRGSFIVRAYFKCKHITPAMLGRSRCDNALMFLVCLRSLGVSFLLDDETANAEQSKFVTKRSEEEEMARRLFEVKQLELRFSQTTLRVIPDVTILEGFRAEAFWNAFDGDQKRIGMMKDDCPPSESSNKTLSESYEAGISTLDPHQAPQVESSVNQLINSTPSPGASDYLEVDDYIEPANNYGAVSKKTDNAGVSDDIEPMEL